MSRYYTVCEFTPSMGTDYRKRWIRVYDRSPDAFIFHDTEKELQVSDLLRPLHVLSSLFEDAKQALVVRVDHHTLAATFSLRGFPVPRKIIRHRPWTPENGSLTYTENWLDKNPLSYWLIRNVSKPSLVPVPFTPNDFYDGCTELVRLTGGCPCEKLEKGECLKEVVMPQLPEEFSLPVLTTDFRIDQTALKRVRYREVGGFKFTSTKTTTNDDFEIGMRPWDGHDFHIVDERRADFSKRGHVRHARIKFRKDKCSTCAFSIKIAENKYADCGDIHFCTDSIDEPTVWALMYNWYNTSGFSAMPGFTPNQRDYLISYAGTTVKAKCLSEARKTKVVFGGFQLTYAKAKPSPEWAYVISAAAGTLTRYKVFDSYDKLREVFPELPENPEPTPLSPRIRLACALLGSLHHLYVPYTGRVSIHTIEARTTYVEATGANTRYKVGSTVLHCDDPVRKYYRIKWACGHAATEAKKLQLPVVPQGT